MKPIFCGDYTCAFCIREGVMPLPEPTKSESEIRKGQPLMSGCIDYFPDALLAVAELSRIANDKHNPGEPMHWSKDKSNDHADCAVRHLVDRGKWDTSMGEPVRHSTAAAWRTLANLQIEIENERKQPEPNPWIEWRGGNCPVMDGTIIGWQSRGGMTSSSARAGALRWKHTGEMGDIMAYQVSRSEP